MINVAFQLVKLYDCQLLKYSSNCLHCTHILCQLLSVHEMLRQGQSTHNEKIGDVFHMKAAL